MSICGCKICQKGAFGHSNSSKASVLPPPVHAQTGGCNCVEHATIVTPKSPQVCQYSEAVVVLPNPQGDWGIEDEPPAAPIRVMEEDGFWIEKRPDNNKTYDQHESWVLHFCPHTQWSNCLDEEHMMKHGQCFHCNETVPPGIIALWTMHNWEYLQTSEGQSNFGDIPELGTDLNKVVSC